MSKSFNLATVIGWALAFYLLWPPNHWILKGIIRSCFVWTYAIYLSIF